MAWRAFAVAGMLAIMIAATCQLPAVAQVHIDLTHDQLIARQAEQRRLHRQFMKCVRRMAGVNSAGDPVVFTALLRLGYERASADVTDIDMNAIKLPAPLLHKPTVTATSEPADRDPAGQRRMLALVDGAGAAEPMSPAEDAACKELAAGQIAKVVAGKEVPENQFRDAIGFIAPGARVADCSGVLVSRRQGLALTAAHCVCGRPGVRLFNRDEAASVRRILGASEPEISEGEARARCARSWCAVEGSNVDTGRRIPVIGAMPMYADSCASVPGAVVRGRDLAMVMLARVEAKIELSMADAPVEIIDRWLLDIRNASYGSALLRPGLKMEVVGFGRTGGCPPGINVHKRQASVLVRSAACRSGYEGGLFGCRAGTELVLSNSRGAADAACVADTCNADSGGPVYVDLYGNGYHYLVGITSRGMPGLESKCGPGGIYSLITPAVLAWLRSWGIRMSVHSEPLVAITQSTANAIPAVPTSLARPLELMAGQAVALALPSGRTFRLEGPYRGTLGEFLRRQR